MICAECCSRPTAPRRWQRPAARRSAGSGPASWRRTIPRNAEPRTGLAMGDHAADHRPGVGDRPRGAGRADRLRRTRTWPPPTTAASSTIWSRPTSASPAIRTCARTPPWRNWRSSSRCSAGATGATMTAGNSTPLTDGASAVLLASDEWAAAARVSGARAPGRRADRRRRLRARRRGPADGAGLRDAGVVGPQRSDVAGLRLLRDPRGVRLHRAGHAEGVGGPGVLQGRSSASTPRWASIDRSRLNVNGSSLAAGHPFAATGGRIVATLAKLLHEAGPGKRGPDLDLRGRRPGRRRHPRKLMKHRHSGTTRGHDMRSPL